jgi:hypothetical protein
MRMRGAFTGMALLRLCSAIEGTPPGSIAGAKLLMFGNKELAAVPQVQAAAADHIDHERGRR